VVAVPINGAAIVVTHSSGLMAIKWLAGRDAVVQIDKRLFRAACIGAFPTST
jgi:hypothetical protein